MSSEAEPPSVVKLTEKIKDWYWHHGCHRSGSYHIPLSDWVAPLYQVNRTATAVEGSQRQLRPAMAIWGPSQTGKSTSVSAYMDAGASAEIVSEEKDGRNSGLHWEGGPGFFFMAPLVDNPEKLPAYLTRKVLNPYNKGMDGSSCLTRFTAASLENLKGHLWVRDPKHPVEIHLVTPRDLLHALACGYATECLGPGAREPRRWNMESLDKAIKQTRQKVGDPKGKMQREAFERLYDLAEVLLDLVETPGSTWAGLSEDLESVQGRIRAMLEDERFLCDARRVDLLTESLLWEGQSSFTGMFVKMRDAAEHYCGRNGIWSGKRVLVSLEAAALFLNMGACIISYDPPHPENSPHGMLQRLMANLGWKEREGTILIDCDGGGKPIGGDPERFSIMQGLVWELVVPVNIKNLPEKPFADEPDRPNALKRFLEEADILDFPGVGNESKAIDNRIILDPEEIGRLEIAVAAPEASTADKKRAERTFTPLLFFKEIVKRGKTASIVTTYSRRLNIDSFSIFQGIRGYACSNADQLIHGVKSWWRHAVPEWAANPVGPSPLPLNVVLLWWATQLNKAVNPNDSNIYGVIEGIVANLGIVRDPETATTFAIHYYNSPDRDFAEIKLDFKPGSKRYSNLLKEPLFARQFQQEASRKSFDSMITDFRTGGSQYFFEEALRQLRDTRANTETNRPRMLQLRRVALEDDLKSLLLRRHLRPVFRPRDERREKLIAFREKFLELLRNASDARLKTVNHALRQLLDLRYEALDSVPASPDAEFIEAQLNRWISAQLRRWDVHQDGHSFSSLWQMLGLESKEDLQSLLEAILLSIRPDFANLAEWLEKRVTRGSDLAARRLLAIKLQNALCYTKDGARISCHDEFEDKIPRPGYTLFVEPWVGQGGTLDSMIQRDIHPVKRPDQPGDSEIDSIATSLNLPAAES